MKVSRFNATHETRFGVLASPEAFPRKTTPVVDIGEAARTLHVKFSDHKVSIGIGAEDTILLYLFTTEKIDIPETWEGYPVQVRITGVPVAFST